MLKGEEEIKNCFKRKHLKMSCVFFLMEIVESYTICKCKIIQIPGKIKELRINTVYIFLCIFKIFI